MHNPARLFFNLKQPLPNKFAPLHLKVDFTNFDQRSRSRGLGVAQLLQMKKLGLNKGVSQSSYEHEMPPPPLSRLLFFIRQGWVTPTEPRSRSSIPFH